jgi:hypothetical protein
MANAKSEISRHLAPALTVSADPHSDLFSTICQVAMCNSRNRRQYPNCCKDSAGAWPSEVSRSSWKQNGGLAQQGYPLSEPFQEKQGLFKVGARATDDGR